MRIASTARASSTLDLTLRWRCSGCGLENTAVQTLTGEAAASGPAYAGSKTQARMREKALLASREALSRKVRDVTGGHYHTANFRCRCAGCGRREPWARMNYGLLDTLRRVLMSFSCAMGILLVFLVLSGNSTRRVLASPLSLLTLVPLLVWLLLGGVKKGNTAFRTRQTAQLPAHSLPKIGIHTEKPDPKISTP